MIALLELAELWQIEHQPERDSVKVTVWSGSFTQVQQRAIELRRTMTLTAAPESAGQPGCPVISIMSLSPYVMFNSSALAPLRLYKDLECHKVHIPPLILAAMAGYWLSSCKAVDFSGLTPSCIELHSYISRGR